MQITVDTIKQTVHNLDPEQPEDAEEFKVGMILLTALHTGASVRKIASFLELPVAEVKKYEANLRKSKIWVGRKTYHEWSEDLRGTMTFWLDVMVAIGRINKNVEYR